MPQLGAALGDHLVIPAVNLIDMGSLWGRTSGSAPHRVDVTQFAGLQINFPQQHPIMSVFLPPGVGDKVGFAVIVKEQRGINAALIH